MSRETVHILVCKRLRKAPSINVSSEVGVVAYHRIAVKTRSLVLRQIRAALDEP